RLRASTRRSSRPEHAVQLRAPPSREPLVLAAALCPPGVPQVSSHFSPQGSCGSRQRSAPSQRTTAHPSALVRHPFVRARRGPSRHVRLSSPLLPPPRYLPQQSDRPVRPSSRFSVCC